jgi:hypothetical protein
MRKSTPNPPRISPASSPNKLGGVSRVMGVGSVLLTVRRQDDADAEASRRQLVRVNLAAVQGHDLPDRSQALHQTLTAQQQQRRKERL